MRPNPVEGNRQSDDLQFASRQRAHHIHGLQLRGFRQFSDIVDLLAPGDLLVMNNTRVLKARFFGVKETGGNVEVLVERVLPKGV